MGLYWRVAALFDDIDHYNEQPAAIQSADERSVANPAAMKGYCWLTPCSKLVGIIYASL